MNNSRPIPLRRGDQVIGRLVKSDDTIVPGSSELHDLRVRRVRARRQAKRREQERQQRKQHGGWEEEREAEARRRRLRVAIDV